MQTAGYRIGVVFQIRLLVFGSKRKIGESIACFFFPFFSIKI